MQRIAAHNQATRRDRSWASTALGLSLVLLACPAAPDQHRRSDPTAEATPPAKTADPRVAEFNGAYPGDRPPTATTRRYSLRAAQSTVQLFEGRSLDVWAYNDQVPGPVLRVALGETLEVAFANDLPDPTTIHWHGVRVPNAMDGVPGVSQEPVLPSGSFRYEFAPKDAGTFWFHPHVRGAEQVERGLYGVLIVDELEPPAYSQDVVWVLDDWKLTPDGEAIDPRFVTRHDLAHDGRWGQVIAVNGSTDERLTVAPGERIRIRLVNTANGRVFRPDLAVLDAQVIAVDGMYAARPLDPAGFVLAPGNRIDLDVTIPPDAAGESLVVNDKFTRRVHRLATIEVRGDPVPTPAFASPAAAHVPEWANANSTPVDLDFQLGAVRGGKYGIQWQINGRAHPDHDKATMVQGRWNKLRFVNNSGRLHPMHIHGQFFKVLSRNGEPADEPYWRDTVLLRPREQIEVGMVPLDAGRWALHCHILEHAEAGMMTMVDVVPADHN